MKHLDTNDARRMRGVLSRLLSDSDGERLAAVDALLRLCGKAGMSVVDLAPEPAQEAVEVPADPKAERRAMHPDFSGPFERMRVTGEHQRTALRLLWSLTKWADYERKFLADLSERRNAPTPKQAAWLRNLEVKARRQRERRDADRRAA